MLLPVEYGKTLDEHLMSLDAFYALHELFLFSAYSICQYLNMIESIITTDTGYAAARNPQYSLSNLLYHQDLLEKQERNIRASIKNIKDRGAPSWPCAKASTVQAESTRIPQIDSAAASLLQDYQELLHRTSILLARCRTGVTLTMSRASITESKRAISQARKIEQLTLLAFFYIPLSFTTSFFGMNLGVIYTGQLGIWVWFLVSLPVLLLSYGLLRLMKGSLRQKDGL